MALYIKEKALASKKVKTTEKYFQNQDLSSVTKGRNPFLQYFSYCTTSRSPLLIMLDLFLRICLQTRKLRPIIAQEGLRQLQWFKWWLLKHQNHYWYVLKILPFHYLLMAAMMEDLKPFPVVIRYFDGTSTL